MDAIVLDGVTADELRLAARQCGFDPIRAGVRAIEARPCVSTALVTYRPDHPETVGTTVIYLQWESAPYTVDGGYEWGRGTIHRHDLIRVAGDVTGYTPGELRAVIESAIEYATV